MSNLLRVVLQNNFLQNFGNFLGRDPWHSRLLISCTLIPPTLSNFILGVFSWEFEQSSEANLELPQTSRMESFAKILSGLKPLTIVAKLSILDVYGNLIPDTSLQLIPEVYLEPSRTSTMEHFCENS